MTEVQLSRENVEIVGAEGTVGEVTRSDVSTLGIGDSAVEAQISRIAVEVVAAEGTVGEVTRSDVSTLGIGDSAVEAQLSRMAVEIVGAASLQGAITRSDVSSLGLGSSPVEVQVSRMAIECVARQGSAGVVTPLPLMDDANIMLHNWATRAEMSTSFRNSVTGAPSTGAESRRGFGAKPFRTLKLEWMICEDPRLTVDDLERLEVFLRRMTGSRFQSPIYMDQGELDAAYITTDTTILLDTSMSRFFPGQRIGIVQLDAFAQVSGVTFHLISDLTSSDITLQAALGVNVAQGSLVFPIMDCEIALEVEADYTTAATASVKVTVAEAPGASNLGPLKSDTPTNAETYAGKPIWFEEPNWESGIVKGRDRQGQTVNTGRANSTIPEADRARQTHTFQISGKRASMWNALEFFETRRGRLRTFWHIDQDQYMRIAELEATGTFIGVEEFGDIADFEEEMDWIGLVMLDGRIFVRQAITISAVLTVYRVTVDTPVDSGMLVTDVARVARARKVRFVEDEFREVWSHTGYMTSGISVIETLDEENYTT